MLGLMLGLVPGVLGLMLAPPCEEFMLGHMLAAPRVLTAERNTPASVTGIASQPASSYRDQGPAWVLAYILGLVPSIYPSIAPGIHPSIAQSRYHSMTRGIYPSICLSICLIDYYDSF